MKILDPTNTTHLITLQPRFKPTGVFVFNLTNEVTDIGVIIANTYTYVSGVLNLTFDLTVLEGQRYSIKLTENNVVIFRGKIFCTEQEPQDYKQTKNKYIYV